MFRVLSLHLVCSGTWLGSLCKVHITLQELLVVTLMLHEMAFHLSHELHVLHLDNSTAKVYLCNQGGTGSSFHSRQACHILHLAYMHGITVSPAYIPTHINVGDDYHGEGQFQSITFLLS